MISGEPDTWVVVLETRDGRRSNEAGLVLTALEIDYEMTRVQGRWVISVPAEHAAQASTELGEYEDEKLAPPVGTRQIVELSDGWSDVIGYVVVLLVVAACVRQGAFDLDWLGSGRIDSERVIAGEWWRTLTALTLHVDLSHLLGNLVFGSFFGLYVGRYLGAGVGWSAVLAGGALGNALNVAIQPGRHLSIGASTAVFAALGLLVAYTWQKGFLKNTPWRTRIAPVTAGIGLLAFTGTGSGVEGDTTDVLAHLMGFVAGFGIGLVVAHVRLPEDPDTQRVWAVGGLGALALAWLTALGFA